MIGIVVSTSECNLRCKYCYEHAVRHTCQHTRSEANALFCRELDSLKEYAALLTALARRGGRTLQLILHGGEPLLLTRETLLLLFARLKEAGCERIQVQTNGTLLTPGIADALAQYAVSVVLSIDGPEKIHDTYRMDAGGCGSFQRVMKAVYLLHERAVPVSALATITAASWDKASVLYDFFNLHHLDFSVNRCFPAAAVGIDEAADLDEARYGQFLTELFAQYQQRKEGSVRIHCFDRCLHDLKKTSTGYLYVPRISPFISAYHVETHTYKFVATQDVHTFDNADDYMDFVLREMGHTVAAEDRSYTGTPEECVVAHLCWQQAQDYRAALEVNV